MKTATEVKRMEDWKSDARMYRLSEPHEGHEYVIVSAVVLVAQTDPVARAICDISNALSGWSGEGEETLIFGCDADGGYEELLELPGSFQGSQDHAKALRNAGYEIAGS